MSLLDPDAQLGLTWHRPAPIPPRQRSVDPAERPRLSGQCAAILARLRQGPATNAELAEIALKYSGRISDLRSAGYRVTLLEYDRKTGRAVYGLDQG